MEAVGMAQKTLISGTTAREIYFQSKKLREEVLAEQPAFIRAVEKVAAKAKTQLTKEKLKLVAEAVSSKINNRKAAFPDVRYSRSDAAAITITWAGMVLGFGGSIFYFTAYDKTPPDSWFSPLIKGVLEAVALAFIGIGLVMPIRYEFRDFLRARKELASKIQRIMKSALRKADEAG